MNQSQRVLREIADNPIEAVAFLKKLKRILGMLQYGKFFVAVGFLLGYLFGLATLYFMR